MNRILILGAGTAGTMVAVKLRRALEPEEWSITVVDRDDDHLYQPGLLFVPFGLYTRKDLFKARHRFIPPGVDFVLGELDAIDVDERSVRLQDGTSLGYDWLVIATGARISPADTPGLDGPGWREKVFDFYTPEGSLSLARKLRDFKGGRVVINIVEMPIKCPVAPLEFAFLADAYFTEHGLRQDVELVYATPLTGAFTKQRCSDALSYLLTSRGIRMETQYNTGEVDGEKGVLSSYDG
ncbi:MAG TPA: FAD-dependent oxidoreductase, partial [Longimicrobiales bacterium]